MKPIPVLSTLISLALVACGGKTQGDTTPPLTPPPDAAEPETAPPDAAPVAEVTPDAAPEPGPDPREALRTAEAAAYETAKPVFEKNCSKCHTKGAAKASATKLGHFDMTTYPFGGHHADEISRTIGHVLGIDGAKPSMPKDKPGAVKGDELEAIKAWIAAYDAAEAGGAHEAASPDAHHHHH